MFRLRSLAVSLALCLLLCLAARAQLTEYGDGGPGPFKAQHLTIELTSLSPAVAPGGTGTVGVVITLEEHWHVYWINAGDSGEPPQVKWTLPAGITLGPQQFPEPSQLPLATLMDFGYEDTVAFPFALKAAPTLKPGPVHLDAHVTYLVCREVCIPGKAHLGLDLQVDPAAQPGPELGALGQAIKQLPQPLPADKKLTVLGGSKELTLTLHTGQHEEDAEFYPFDPGLIVNAASQEITHIPDGIRLTIPRAEDPDHPGQYPKLPATLHGLFKLPDEASYEFTLPVVPGEPPPDPQATAPAGSTAGVTVLSAIGLAFAGGIILNLMPCVFPVLFLKGLALVQGSGEERRRLRAHGLVYTLGILVSFWVIVAALLILRAGGRQAGWGFQLQSPTFIAVLACFLFFFALSLAGQFDLGLSLTSAGGDLARKEGYAGSFFTGVLATVVATPCTAPLMGAAIGFALAQPPAVTFAVFTALALGLAVPYLALTLQPAWMRLLPRPGAWMEVLKQLTAVPLFGTVIWLVWVYGQLFAANAGEGVDHVARLLTALLVLAIAGWVLARWPARWGAAAAAGVLVVAALAVPLTASSKERLDWQPYSKATLDAARAAGHPVLIDFTAAWCLSCQVNEKLVLRSPEVESALTAHHFTLIRADWTQYAPAITAELAAVHRSGVPTYVLYPAGPGSQPDVLPELLTKPLVLEAIARDAK